MDKLKRIFADQLTPYLPYLFSIILLLLLVKGNTLPYVIQSEISKFLVFSIICIFCVMITRKQPIAVLDEYFPFLYQSGLLTSIFLIVLCLVMILIPNSDLTFSFIPLVIFYFLALLFIFVKTIKGYIENIESSSYYKALYKCILIILIPDFYFVVVFSFVFNFYNFDTTNPQIFFTLMQFRVGINPSYTELAERFTSDLLVNGLLVVYLYASKIVELTFLAFFIAAINNKIKNFKNKNK